MQMEQFSSMFILELKPFALPAFWKPLCSLLTAYAPLPSHPEIPATIYRENKEKVCTHLEWLYLLIRWSVLRILFKSRQNSLQLLSELPRGSRPVEGRPDLREPCSGLSSKEGPCFLPGRAGGGWGLYSGSLRSQEKQVMRLTERNQRRDVGILKKASLQLLWENRGVINWWNKLILRPCLRKDLRIYE